MNSKQYSILIGAVMAMIILGVIVLLMVWSSEGDVSEIDELQRSLADANISPMRVLLG